MKNLLLFLDQWITATFGLVLLTVFLLQPANAQSYCTPAYNFVDCNTLQRQAYITTVSLGNRKFSTGCSRAGNAAVVNGGGDPIVLTSGSGYNLTVNSYEYDSRTYSSSYNQLTYGVWIDYDRNNRFDNYELIATTSNPSSTLYTPNEKAGDYLMRIRLRIGTAPLDPCTVQEYGETEDYHVRIVPPAPTHSLYTNQDLCATTTYIFTAYGCPNGTIQWRDQNDLFMGNNPANIRTPQSKNYYAVCVMNGVSSPPSSKIYVTPITISPPAISSNNYNLTVGQSAALTGTGCQNGYITWPNGQVANTITVTPNQTDYYFATCTDNYSGCRSEISNGFTIAVNAPGAPAITASRSVICPNESVTLSANNCSGTVKWSTGVMGSGITVSPTQQTSYSASCVINGLEGAKATTTISVNPRTTLVSQPQAVSVCEGTQASFRVEAVGSGNLSYSWSRNGQVLTDSSARTSQWVGRNVNSANEGAYQVTVSGVCGIVQSATATLQVSAKMTATITPTATNCFGDATGSLSTTVTGGLDNRQFRLKDQGEYQSANAFGNLRAGTYVVQVRDGIGCTTEATAEIQQPIRVTFKLSKPTDAKCAGGTDGGIDIEAEGGNGSFRYALNEGTLQTAGAFRNLKANTDYLLKAVDSKGCTEIRTVRVGAPNEIAVAVDTRPTLCANSNTGSLTILASGGNGTYTYQLNQAPQQVGREFANLQAGTYSLLVKDGNGCEGRATDILIRQPEPLKIAATATPVNCRPGSSTVSLTSTGGTGAVRYQLGSTAATPANQFYGNIGVGSYTVTASDANNCPTTTTVNVAKADTLLVQASARAATCCTCPDGVVVVTGSGGIGSKLISISGGLQSVTANQFGGLKPDTYSVQIRDEAGCVATTKAIVSNATAISAMLTNLKNVSCAGKTDGGATVQVAGGQKPLVYNWQPKTPTDSLGNNASTNRLPEGEFKVSILDSNRCTAIISGTLTAQNPVPPKPTIAALGGNLVSSGQGGMQWYNGIDLKTGKLISGATSATYTPYTGGSYFAINTVDGCSSPASDAFTFVLTANERLAHLALIVMPNPVNGQLIVEIDQPERGIVFIKLIDTMGRTILMEQTPSFRGKQQFGWPLHDVPSGIYQLQAQTGLRKTTQRVLVNQ